jgi:hypothetical protein
MATNPMKYNLLLGTVHAVALMCCPQPQALSQLASSSFRGATIFQELMSISAIVCTQIQDLLGQQTAGSSFGRATGVWVAAPVILDSTPKKLRVVKVVAKVVVLLASAGDWCASALSRSLAS